MKLAVFGGETTLGYSFIKRLLGYGFTANALVEPTGRLPLQHKNLHVTYGAGDDKAAIEKIIEASHAVVCFADTHNDASVIGTIVTGMQANDLRRLIVTTTLANGSQVAGMLQPSRLDWTIVHTAGAGQEKSLLPVDFSVPLNDLAKFVVNQITDVTHLRSAVMPKR